MTLEEKKARASELLQTEIDWYEEDKGTLECPGADRHTKKTAGKHTILYLDGVPTLYCWHQSCAEEVEAANALLRSELGSQTAEEKEDSREKYADKVRAQADATQILHHKDWLLSNYSWPEVFDLRYGPLRYGPLDSFEVFLTLWNPSDVLWVGDVWDTGPIKGTGHFKSAIDWLDSHPNLYANRFTTASTYAPGTVDRMGKNVLTSPYIVAEFDKLSEDIEQNRFMGAAFLQYVSTFWDMKAVVDSGNKSLHGWFARNEKVTDYTQQFVVNLGADAKSMRPAQAVRVPGARRENGKVQSLLWIQ